MSDAAVVAEELPQLAGETVMRETVEIAYAQTSLAEFIRQAWHVIEPVTPYRHNWHIDALADHLEAVADGTIENLLITIPLKMGKSIIAGAFFPAWVWTTRPEMRWLYTSHAFDLAVRDSIKCRDIIESPWYQERWGTVVQLTSDQNEKVRYRNTASGERITTSIDGRGTGEGGHIIVADDIHDVQKVYSQPIRETAIESWDQKLSVRHLPGAKIHGRIICMQRSHHADIAGHVLKQGGYVHLNLPMEYEPARKCVTVLGWSDPREKAGELIWTAGHDEKKVSDLKVRLGSRGYAAQCQQHPTPLEGSIIKEVWLKYFSVRPEKFDRIIQSWDMSFKDTSAGSYVVGATVGILGANKYLIDLIRERMDFVAAVRAVQSFQSKWPEAEAILIEDKANGPAVMSTLKGRIARIIAIEPNGSKEARLHAVSPEFEAGNFWLPLPTAARWVDDYVTEICSFPGCEHDDQVDVTSQVLNWLRCSVTHDSIFGGRAMNENPEAAIMFPDSESSRIAAMVF